MPMFLNENYLASRSWPGPNACRKAGNRFGNDAALQRRPAGIGGGIAAERGNGVGDLRGCHGAIEWLGVDRVGASHREAVDFVAAVELCGAGAGATSPAKRFRQ
jgi:hypothetical protein